MRQQFLTAVARYPLWSSAFLAISCLVAALPSYASTGHSLTLQRVASTNTSGAVYATHSPDPLDANKLFVVHQGGDIRIVDLTTNSVLPDPFLSVDPGDFSYEGGVVGLAFHPNYAENGRFFISRDDGTNVRIEEYQRNALNSDLADPFRVREIWTHEQHHDGHNAGWIGFNPIESEEDKFYLWRTLGDGGGPNGGGCGSCGESPNLYQHDPDNRAQTLEEPHGHVIRIDVGSSSPVDAFPADPTNNYSIPVENPFANTPSTGIANADGHETLARGLRHPWRASFDRETGDFYIGETGQDIFEEINLIPYGDNSGLNFGWRYRDGLIETQTPWVPPQGGTVGGPEPENHTLPIHYFWHLQLPDYGVDNPPIFEEAEDIPADLRGRSNIGGFVYRGPIEALNGYYFHGDSVVQRLWAFRFDGSDPEDFDGNNLIDFINWTNSEENSITYSGGGSSLSGLVSFGEDQVGNVYLVRHGGEILKIADATLNEVPLSIYGDVNLDSQVTLEDLTDFLAGWMQSAPVGEQSWRLGDLNLDGINDIKDVYYMHEGLVDAGLARLSPFGDLLVPEPTSGILGGITTAFAACAVLGRRQKGHQG